MSWDAGSGAASLLFDGAPVTPIWKTDWGAREAAAAGLGGVDPTLSPGSKRGAEGALVLGQVRSATFRAAAVGPQSPPTTTRSQSLVLRTMQDQDCFGGCFSPSDAFFGELAVVRVWGRVLTPDEVRRQMGKARPDAGLDDLAALYVFDQAGVKPAEGGGQLVLDRCAPAFSCRKGSRHHTRLARPEERWRSRLPRACVWCCCPRRSGSGNHLALRSNPPLYVYSTAPLAFSDGRPVAPPLPGAGGYSLALNDKQVRLADALRPLTRSRRSSVPFLLSSPGPGACTRLLGVQAQVALLTDFHDFPSSELTLEFWMWSVDTCRPGVPFSYASGQYEHQDNAFLLFNYNSFGVSVMEDEGSLGDHLSGVSATDGNWHHVAGACESARPCVRCRFRGSDEAQAPGQVRACCSCGATTWWELPRRPGARAAVTWRSSTGKTVLYDNGRPVWTVTRGKGKKIPSGGTLVIGREQVRARSARVPGARRHAWAVRNVCVCGVWTAARTQDCPGGCFDSAAGSAGRVSNVHAQEYGPQASRSV